MDYKVGLVSVSFRKLNYEEIVNAAAKSGIEAIEWGGDIHAPHGDIRIAKDIKALCDSRGIEIAEYGSYYKLCDDTVSFTDVTASAKALVPYVHSAHVFAWEREKKMPLKAQAEEWAEYVRAVQQTAKRDTLGN